MDILSRSPLPADRRVHYGAEPAQFADLWLSRAMRNNRDAKAAPVVVFLHGGWWDSTYDLTHASFFCSAIRDAGATVYSIEYRRLGVSGGGWPATFLDVDRAFDHLQTLAGEARLDLSRVLVAGHSAGAHLAFWLAGRQHIFAGSPLVAPISRLAPVAALSLAGAVDLGLTIELGNERFARGRRAVEKLMGGTPEMVPERYLAGDPGHLLPLNVPQRLVQGTDDIQIPAALPLRWAEKARRVGDHVQVTMLRGAGHLDVIDPESRAGSAALAAAREMLGI